MTQRSDALMQGYELDRYRIERILGEGGFGITYLARHTHTGKPVAIKEYLPSEFALREGGSTVLPRGSKSENAYRWGLARFIDEAKTLETFTGHPNIVAVRDFFEVNGTAYLVMQYEEGQTFGQWLADHPHPTEQQLLDIFIPILDGLREVHSKDYLHRDIKPGNIYLRNNGTPLLIDFGASRQALGEHSKSLSVVLTEGYAAKEQYSKRGNQGAWTDIYAVAATLWRSISGEDPEPAPDRGEARDSGHPDPLRPAVETGRGRYSEGFLKAIDWALAYDPQNRPQTVREWQDILLKGWHEPQKSPPQPTLLHSVSQPIVQPQPTPQSPQPKPISSQQPLSYPKSWWQKLHKFISPSPDLPQSSPATIVSRYRINGDGTVTDTQTGLMWKQCSEGQGGENCSNGSASKYTWSEAMVKFGKKVAFAGHSDWRMPTREELRSLVWCSNGTPQKIAWDNGCCGKNDKTSKHQHPTINLGAFPNTPAWWYWSSTEKDKSYAWYVNFYNGSSSWHGHVNHRYVRLVRSDQ